MTDDDRPIFAPPPGWGLSTPLGLGLLCLALSQPGGARAAGAAVPNAPRRSPRLPVSLKIQRYAQRLIEKYDSSGDGKLDQSEWSQMQGTPVKIDRDRDGLVTATELANHVVRYGRRPKICLTPSTLGGKADLPSLLNRSIGRDASEAAERPKPGSAAEAPLQKVLSPPAPKAGRGGRRGTRFFVPRSQLPRGLPAWFVLRDTDGDAQLTMAEFAPTPVQSQLDEFARYDRNGDGLVTAQECVLGPGLPQAKAATQKDTEDEATEQAVDEMTEKVAPDTSPQAAQKSAPKAAAALKRSRQNRSKKLLKPSSKSSSAKSG